MYYVNITWKIAHKKRSGPSSVHFGIVAGTLHHRHLEGGDSEDPDDEGYSEDQPFRINF